MAELGFKIGNLGVERMKYTGFLGGVLSLYNHTGLLMSSSQLGEGKLALQSCVFCVLQKSPD